MGRYDEAMAELRAATEALAHARKTADRDAARTRVRVAVEVIQRLEREAPAEDEAD